MLFGRELVRASNEDCKNLFKTSRAGVPNLKNGFLCYILALDKNQISFSNGLQFV